MMKEWKYSVLYRCKRTSILLYSPKTNKFNNDYSLPGYKVNNILNASMTNCFMDVTNK